jgi:site-specific recombinase XerD
MGTELVTWQPDGTSADTTVSAKVLSRIADSVPANTKKAYAGDWQRFTEWCASVGRTALPCTSETLAEYASFLADKGRAPASIVRAMSSVRVIHKLAGQPAPDTLPALGVIKSYRNERADAGLPNERQATVLSRDQLRKLVTVLSAGTVMDQRDCTILILGWAMMARRSELVALNISDITEVDTGLDVLIRKTKADQNAIGRKVAIPRAADPEVCPVRFTKEWIALLASRGITEGPLFRRINRKGVITGEGLPWAVPTRHGSPDGRLTGAGIWRVIKMATERAGLGDKGIQAHSLRAGGATGAYLAGADLLTIGRHGGWQDGSTVITRYIRDVDRWQKNPMQGVL